MFKKGIVKDALFIALGSFIVALGVYYWYRRTWQPEEFQASQLFYTATFHCLFQ